MSRRSRKSGPAITLFFFQDIIMSTSGIMMMIVLMLCLELIERQEVSASTEVTPVEQIEDEVSTLQRHVDALELRVAEVSRMAAAAAQMSMSDRKNQTALLQAANRVLTSELERLEDELGRSEPTDAAKMELKAKREALLDERDQAQRDLLRLETLIQEEEQQDRPIFSISNGNQRQGWIVDLSAERILVAPIGMAQQPIAFSASRSVLRQLIGPEEAFLTWSVGSQSRTRPYYFLFVRPSGVAAFETISESFNKRGVTYGYDLATPRQTLLDSQRGAGE